jgi:hypothetical protein
MSKRSTKSTPIPVLFVNLLALLRAQRNVFSQERTFRRGLGLFFAELMTFARHTVTQQLLALGLTDADWSAWYRLFSHDRFDVAQARLGLLQATLPASPQDQPYPIGVDSTLVPRSSLKFPGSSWLKALGTDKFKPGLRRAQRFLNLSWLTPMAEGFSRAIPLGWWPAFPEKAVSSVADPCKEWEAGLNAIRWVRQQLDTAGRKQQRILALVDGGFEKAVAFWQGLPERVILLGRTARNRVLYALPVYSGKGRPPFYGERSRQPGEWLKERTGWHTTTLTVRGHPRESTYRVEGPYVREHLPDHPVFLIVVKGMDRKVNGRRVHRDPVYYLVSALHSADTWVLPYAVEILLTWAWQRWELEVQHREIKSGFGLGEKQCWNSHSAVVSVQWSAWVYGVLVLAGYQTWGLLGGPQRVERWWPGGKRWSFNTLWRAYRAAVWQIPDFQALWLGSGDNWGKKETWIAGLWNAVLGAARS